jgi:hypothetical protein
MFKIDRKIFKNWTEGKGGGYRCTRAELRLRRGETIILTVDGLDFTRMKIVDGRPKEMTLEES